MTGAENASGLLLLCSLPSASHAALQTSVALSPGAHRDLMRGGYTIKL